MERVLRASVFRRTRWCGETCNEGRRASSLNAAEQSGSGGLQLVTKAQNSPVATKFHQTVESEATAVCRTTAGCGEGNEVREGELKRRGPELR
jgi:hypothetical protein